MSSDPFQATGWPRRIIAVATILIAALFTVPLLWMIVSGLRPESEIFTYVAPLQLRTFVPTTIDASAYAALFGSPFARALANSIYISVVTVGLGLLISSLAAFALTAIEVRGRGVVFAVVVVAFLVPFDAIAVPMSSTFRSWNLTNTYTALILPGLGNGLAIFLLRQFFLGIRTELRDAALVDGATWFTIYRRLYLPLARPAMIGAGLILFLFQWQSYLWPLLITTDRSMDVAPVALARFFGELDVQFGQLFAGSSLLGLIPAAFLLFYQRQFAESVSTSGLKE